MRRVSREAAILGGYLAFCAWATWPLVSRMFSRGSANSDYFYDGFMLWWVKEQVFALENPYYTDHLLAPVGLMHGSAPPLGILMAPVTELFGPGVTRNLLSFLIPVACAYVTYRLVLRLGLSRGVSVITGGLFGFSTMLVIRTAAHLNIAAGVLLVPLALLFAVRFVQRRSLLDAVAFGAVLGVAVLTSADVAIFAVALSMGYLVAVYVKDRAHPREWLKPLALATVTGFVIALPQLLALVDQSRVENANDRLSLVVSYLEHNTSIAAMFSPSPNLRLAPWGLDELIWGADTGELIPTFGWGLVALAVVGVVLTRRRWLTLGLFGAFAVGALLALGPEITFTSNPSVPLPRPYGGHELSGLTPYTWLVKLPFFDQLRVSARFTLYVLLPAALLAGLGLQALRDRGRFAHGVAIVLVGLAILEAGWPVLGSEERSLLGNQVPLNRDELYAPVKADATDSIVVDVPLAFGTGLGVWYGGDIADLEGMLRATEHEHPIATGYIARLPQSRADAMAEHRFYADIIARQSGATRESVARGEDEAFAGRLPEEFVRPPDPRAGATDARAMGVGWVVIWPGLGVSDDVRRYVRRAGFSLVQVVDGIELYRAPTDWSQPVGG